MLGVLTATTDSDFAVRFKGHRRVGHAFTLRIESLSDLDAIEILNAHGGPKDRWTKSWEFEQALARIKANPDEEFDTTGGNRGVIWYRTPHESSEDASLVDKLSSVLLILDRDDECMCVSDDAKCEACFIRSTLNEAKTMAELHGM